MILFYFRGDLVSHKLLLIHTYYQNYRAQRDLNTRFPLVAAACSATELYGSSSRQGDNLKHIIAFASGIARVNFGEN